MNPKVATAALLCAVLAPHAVLAQGSTNENTCSISSGGSSTGNITVEGTAGQVGQTVTLSSLSVTFPTKLSEQPIIELYNQGAFGPPTPGGTILQILTELTVQVNATNTLPGSQLLTTLQNVTVEIQDDDLTFNTGNEYLAPLDATFNLPPSVWSPTDLYVEFTQTVFIAMSGGITIDCAPSSTPVPFESITVTTTPCDDVNTCNFPNGGA
jgi:protein-disulfide isomerase